MGNLSDLSTSWLCMTVWSHCFSHMKKKGVHLIYIYSMSYMWMLCFINISPMSSLVSAETLQKNLEVMGHQIKNLEKNLETFPPPQNDKDLFVEKMSISS